MRLEQANLLQQQGKTMIKNLDTTPNVSRIIREFHKIRSYRLKNMDALDYALSQMVERGEVSASGVDDLRITVTGYHSTPYYRTFMAILNQDKRKQQKLDKYVFIDVLADIADMYLQTSVEKSKEEYLEMFLYLLRYIDGLKITFLFLEIILDYPDKIIFFIRQLVKKLSLKELELLLEELNNLDVSEQDIYFHKITPQMFHDTMRELVEEVANEARARLKKRSHSVSFGRSSIPSKRPRPQTAIQTKKWFLSGKQQTQQLDSYWKLYKSIPASSRNSIPDIVGFLSHQPNINVASADRMLEFMLKNNLVLANDIKDLTRLISGLDDQPLLKSIDFVLKTKLSQEFVVNYNFNKNDMLYRELSPLAMSAFMHMKTNSPKARKQYSDLILKLSSPPYNKFFKWAPRQYLIISWFLFRMAIWRYYDLMRDLASSMSDELLNRIIRDTKYLMDSYHSESNRDNRNYLESKNIKSEDVPTLFRRMLRIFTTEQTKRKAAQQKTQSQRSQSQQQQQSR